MTLQDWTEMREQMKTICEAWAEILRPTMEAISKAVRIITGRWRLSGKCWPREKAMQKIFIRSQTCNMPSVIQGVRRLQHLPVPRRPTSRFAR